MKNNTQIESAWYVTTTDTFMSGWGRAKDKINKLIFICDSFEQAETVAENARNRGDQKAVNITPIVPYYSAKKYYAQFKTIEDYPNWYKKGAF